MSTITPGAQVRLRKAHPCGSTDWEVMRAGAEVRLRCLGCERVVVLSRRAFDKRLKTVLGDPPDDQVPPEGGVLKENA